MNDDHELEPWLGGARWSRSKPDGKYLHGVLVVASRSGPFHLRRPQPFKGIKFGRGTAAAAALSMPGRYLGLRSRQAVVRAQVFRLGPYRMRAALAHLKYIQRDGVTRSGERGLVYSASEERADGRAFLEGCRNDRHQFRIVISPEDGAEYDELKPLIRRFMARIEDDLGTPLQWVAADHADTLHPHSHIILRGKDDRSGDLVIAPAYLNQGMQERLAGLVSIDLGPRSETGIGRNLRMEVAAERMTSLDQQLLWERDSAGVITVTGSSMLQHSLLHGRLHKLASLGLANHLAREWWQITDGLEAQLGAIERRAEGARRLNLELHAAGIDRAPAQQAVHPPDASVDVVGRIVAARCAQTAPTYDYLVIDAVDGRSHYIELGHAAPETSLVPGVIARVTVRHASETGAAKRWANLTVLSSLCLEELATQDGATWLDRELVSPSIVPRDLGFGREVRSELAKRRQWLLEQGLAATCDSGFTCCSDMLAVLERREITRAAAAISAQSGLAYLRLDSASEVTGILRPRVELASGRYAMIDNGHEFALVPWQPQFEGNVNKTVRGTFTADGLSWTIGRERGIEM